MYAANHQKSCLYTPRATRNKHTFTHTQIKEKIYDIMDDEWAMAQSSKTPGMFCIRVEECVSMRQFPVGNIKAELIITK